MCAVVLPSVHLKNLRSPFSLLACGIIPTSCLAEPGDRLPVALSIVVPEVSCAYGVGVWFGDVDSHALEQTPRSGCDEGGAQSPWVRVGLERVAGSVRVVYQEELDPPARRGHGGGGFTRGRNLTGG